ncbi:MAG: hypothetical protein GY858_05500, partial [Candidatus Omnitrophica bacterium]|nr:hypothetical protein [Candidatus Omnitrophota bacterium]
DGVIEIFKRIVIAKYRSRANELDQDYSHIRQQLNLLEEKRGFIIKKAMEGVVEDDDLKAELKLIKKQKLEYKKQSKPIIDKELNIDAILEYAESFIRTVEKCWYDAPFKQKLVYQKMIYPKGIIYLNTGFRTAGLSPTFQYLHTLTHPKNTNGEPSLPSFEPIITELQDWYQVLQPVYAVC